VLNTSYEAARSQGAAPGGQAGARDARPFHNQVVALIQLVVSQGRLLKRLEQPSLDLRLKGV
jgi:hypothetical protein